MKSKDYIEEDEIDLRELFKLLWRRRFFILVFTLVCTILAAVYSFSKTPIYEVKSLIQIGYVNGKNLEDSSLLGEKLSIIFNVDNQNNTIKQNSAIVSKITALKKFENLLEIKTQAFSNELAIRKNKEVLEFIQTEYRRRIEEYIFNINIQIENLKRSLEKVNKVDKENVVNEIKKIEKQVLTRLNEEIKFLKEVDLRVIENKLAFNKKKIFEYEKNLKKLSSQKNSNDTQNLIIATQVLSNQNLILNLQNKIEELDKQKANILDLRLKDLENKKENIKNEQLKKLIFKRDVLLKEKSDSLKEQIKQLEIKLTSDYVKNSDIVGGYIINENPIKPKKSLIIVVSFVTGFILSIFIVFFLEFFKGLKEDKDD